MVRARGERNMRAKGAAAFLLTLLLCGCMGQEPQPVEEEPVDPPKDAQTASGVVLDITQDTLILRTNAGMEYVLDLGGDEIPPDVEVLNGSFVKIYYDGDLQLEPNHVDVLYIEPDESDEVAAGYQNSTADGRVAALTKDTLELETETGAVYSFSIAQAKQKMNGKLEEGSFVRLTFDGMASDTEKALVKQITELELTGIVASTPVTVQQYDDKTKMLTVETWDGVQGTFSTKQVQCGADAWEDLEWEEAVVYANTDVADDGWYLGKVLKVVPADDARQQMYGVVESFDSEQGVLLLHSMTGETLELSLDEEMVPSEGLDKNDTVCVTYEGWLNGADTREMELTEIEVESKGSKSENSIAGMVWELNEESMTLRTMSGKTLHFTQKAAEQSVPETVAVGNPVRVYFTGWLTGENEEENAVITHVAQLLI